ncbi:aldo/keto reductase [Streptomyces sp. TLI_171]|uniref:aldo/keto reductase n=1 Tax=Streptomyces sp. TLI_171 TaxID=1938859 RepID=UPI000C19D939|nr:aldo/keto reductase [Streptomyces sp. TLI_171]RKE20787.1 aryl-alcohol dehydrogenase-like predicted oxidoreductase [Streptomyces sp. TLI_171]
MTTPPTLAEAGPIGLGCQGMSWIYDEAGRDDARSAAVLREALDLGVRHLDTSDIYGDGHNEELLGKALAGRRDDAFLATKAGLVVDDLEARVLHRDGSPAHLRRAVEASLRRLGTDRIDLYYLHRIDPAVPLAESWGALAELVAEGKVRQLGLSEVSAAEAAAAHRLHPVAAVQSELSLWTREPLGEGGILEWCAANGAAFVAFAPLGRGFLTGSISSASFTDEDFRAHNGRFTAEAIEANLRIVRAVEPVAARHGATLSQTALAWTLAQGPHVVTIPGTRNSRHLRDNAAAGTLHLTDADLHLLDAVPAPVGNRY